MAKMKKKLVVSLLAISCVGACVGAGISAKEYVSQGVTAQADVTYTTHEIGSLSLHVNSTVGGAKGNSAVLYLQRADGQALPVLSWEVAFVYESGDGFAINGVQATPTAIKSTGDGFYWEFGTRSAGDVISISGTFTCEAEGVKYVIEESKFVWDGSAWSIYTEPVGHTTYEVGGVLTSSDSSATAVYFYRADEAAFAVTDGTWAEKLTFLAGSGVGITLNGTQLAMDDIKIPNKIYVGLGVTAVENDVLVIGGTFYNDTLAVKYVIEESKFIWNGSAWEVYTEVDTEVVEYTTYNLGALTVHTNSCNGTSSCKASNLYTARADGEALPVLSWEVAFVCESGDGLKVNGETATLGEMKSTNEGLFLAFSEVAVGDVVSISGTFVCEAQLAKYVIEESTFVWNGSIWTENVGEVEYTTHEIGALILHGNSSGVGGAARNSAVLYLQRADGQALPVLSWDYVFTYESGDGFAINGEQVTPNAIKSTGDGFFWEFGARSAGDVISISGTFVCESQAVKYVIDESKFVWNGSSWEAYVEYTEYDVGSLFVISSSSTSSVVYLYRADGEKFAVANWDDKYTLAVNGGIGITLNGEALTAYEMKVPNDVYLPLGTTAVANDVLKIGGTFYSVSAQTKYIIAESTFIFDGTVWNNEIDVIRSEAKAELDTYKASFNEDDYYATEWTRLNELVESGKTNIDAATTQADVTAALNAAKTAMDEVYTKTEADADIDMLGDRLKAELATYKSEEDYRAEEWAEIQAIIDSANAEIDAAESITAILDASNAAKAEMDAVKTDAQLAAEEAAVTTAKAELASYKTESDYRAEQWTEIQEILAQANTALDGAIGNETAISDIVTTAKAAMDEVKTATQMDAIEAMVASAMSELNAYKTEADYKAAQWTEIQEIIAQANTEIVEANGDETVINGIVSATKAEIDAVKTAAQVDEEELKAARDAAKKEVQSYYASLNLDLYDDEGNEQLTNYVQTAVNAIATANSKADLDEIVAQFKTNVDSVEKVSADSAEDSADNDNENNGGSDGEGGVTILKGCAGIVDGGISVSVAALAVAALTTLRKKKED